MFYLFNMLTLSGMGRQRKQLRMKKITQGDLSPLPLEKDADPPIKVPPLRIKIKTSQRPHGSKMASCSTCQPPCSLAPPTKTRKPVQLESRAVPPTMIQLQKRVPLPQKPLKHNAWSKPLPCTSPSWICSDDDEKILVIDSDSEAPSPPPPPSTSPMGPTLIYVQGENAGNSGKDEQSRNVSANQPNDEMQKGEKEKGTVPAMALDSPIDLSSGVHPQDRKRAYLWSPSSNHKAPRLTPICTKPAPQLTPTMILLQEAAKIPSPSPASDSTQMLHAATEKAFFSLKNNIDHLHNQLNHEAELDFSSAATKPSKRCSGPSVQHLPSASRLPLPSRPAATVVTSTSQWDSNITWSSDTVKDLLPQQQSSRSRWKFASAASPTQPPLLSSADTQSSAPQPSGLDPHEFLRWKNIQQDRELQFLTSGPPVKIETPRLFPQPYEVSQEMKVFGKTHHASWTLSQQEIRKADVTFSFTLRLGNLLFEAMRRSPEFLTLQGIDNSSWTTQSLFLGKVLKPFMQVRSIASMVHWFNQTYGKDSHLSTTMFEIWASFQLAKMTHPFAPTPSTHLQYQPNMQDSLLTFPKLTTCYDNDFFSPLPILPGRDKLWFQMTHRMDTKTPFESFAFLRWLAVHDADLARAATAPLFENGTFTHIWGITFPPQSITMMPEGPQIEVPVSVRLLRIYAMLLASKIVKVSLLNTYPKNVNPSAHVFMTMPSAEISEQNDATDLLCNRHLIPLTGWTEAMWYHLFGTPAKLNDYYHNLTKLKDCSLYHLSKPPSLSTSTWSTHRPVKDITKAHQFTVARYTLTILFIFNDLSSCQGEMVGTFLSLSCQHGFCVISVCPNCAISINVLVKQCYIISSPFLQRLFCLQLKFFINTVISCNVPLPNNQKTKKH